MAQKEHRKKLLLNIFLPVLAALVFMVFCMINLQSSIWFDESYSAYLVRGDFAQIWNLTAADVHPPLFYFCLKVWSLIFGTSDFAMRFMSVFFGALTIIFLFQLLKRWFGIKAAGIASFALSVSPMFLRYGQEMRMYTLVFFIVILATYVLDLALETKKTRYYIMYAILIALGMWTHYFTAIAWLAHIIYYMATRRAKVWDKKWLLVYGLAILLYLPWVPSFIAQVTEVQKGFWIAPVTLLTPINYASQALVFADAEQIPSWLMLLVSATLILLIVLTIQVYKKIKQAEKTHFLLILALVLLPPLLLVLLSLPPLKPMFMDRYIIYSAALVWTLIGLVIALKKRTGYLAASVLFVIVTIGSAIVGIINVETRVPEGSIKSTVAAIDVISEDGEPIVASDEWIYYDAVFYSTAEHPIYGIDSWINYQYGSIFPIRELKYNLATSFGDFTNEYSRFWCIIDSDGAENWLDEKESSEPLLSKYKVVSEISDGKYAAIELEKL